jgi:hypothetical protein
MSVSSIINNAVTGAGAAATQAASGTGNAANSAAAFQTLLAQMEGGATASASSNGTQTASTDPLDALGSLTAAGAAGVEQMLGNAIQQALQAYGASSASNALPTLSIG